MPGPIETKMGCFEFSSLHRAARKTSRLICWSSVVLQLACSGNQTDACDGDPTGIVEEGEFSTMIGLQQMRPEWDAIGVGIRHCSVEGNVVNCWGAQAYYPVQVALSDDIAQLSLSPAIARGCALLGSGVVECFDVNTGEGPWAESDAATFVDVGERFDCRVGAAGDLRCTDLQGGSDVVDVGPWRTAESNETDVCGLNAAGVVRCWSALQSEPYDVSGRFVDIGLGGTMACGVTDGGHLTCWRPLSFEPCSGLPADFSNIEAGGLCACGSRAGGTSSCVAPTGLDVILPVEPNALPVLGNDSGCAKNGDLVSCWGGEKRWMLTDLLPEPQP